MNTCSELEVLGQTGNLLSSFVRFATLQRESIECTVNYGSQASVLRKYIVVRVWPLNNLLAWNDTFQNNLWLLFVFSVSHVFISTGSWTLNDVLEMGGSPGQTKTYKDKPDVFQIPPWLMLGLGFYIILPDSYIYKTQWFNDTYLHHDIIMIHGTDMHGSR